MVDETKVNRTVVKSKGKGDYYLQPTFWMWIALSSVTSGWVAWTTNSNLETIENRRVIEAMPAFVRETIENREAIKAIPTLIQEMILLRKDLTAMEGSITTLQDKQMESAARQEKLEKRQWNDKAVNKDQKSN